MIVNPINVQRSQSTGGDEQRGSNTVDSEYSESTTSSTIMNTESLLSSVSNNPFGPMKSVDKSRDQEDDTLSSSVGRGWEEEEMKSSAAAREKLEREYAKNLPPMVNSGLRRRTRSPAEMENIASQLREMEGVDGIETEGKIAKVLTHLEESATQSHKKTKKKRRHIDIDRGSGEEGSDGDESLDEKGGKSGEGERFALGGVRRRSSSKGEKDKHGVPVESKGKRRRSVEGKHEGRRGRKMSLEETPSKSNDLHRRRSNSSGTEGKTEREQAKKSRKGSLVEGSKGRRSSVTSNDKDGRHHISSINSEKKKNSKRKGSVDQSTLPISKKVGGPDLSRRRDSNYADISETSTVIMTDSSDSEVEEERRKRRSKTKTGMDQKNDNEEMDDETVLVMSSESEAETRKEKVSTFR